MTTLDDAAERRIREIASSAMEEVAVRTAWTEATEAAAKKCEERQAEAMVLREAIVQMCVCVKSGEGATIISYMEMFKEDPGVADAITTVQIVLAGTSG